VRVEVLGVVQNVFTSLFNSHLFDFHEGWMYVLGVGIAGGMTFKGKSPKTDADQAGKHLHDHTPDNDGL
jgi:O-antigen ligase